MIGFLLRYALLMCLLILKSTEGAGKSAVIDEISTALKVLFKELNIPIRLTAMVCWDFEFSLKFYQKFSINSNENYLFKIVSVDAKNFPHDIVQFNQAIILVDVNCQNTMDLLNQAKEQLRLNYKWVFISTAMPQNDEMDIKMNALLSSYAILPSSEIYYISKCYHNPSCKIVIKTVYRTAMAAPLIIQPFGYQYTSYSFFPNPRNTVGTQRRSLNGITLRVCIVITNSDSLNHLTDYQDKHIDSISKISFQLTSYLISYLNATPNYTSVSSWGYMDENGRYDGMIYKLLNNESDIGGSALYFTIDRLPLIQFIASPILSGSKFFFRAPKLSYTDNIFLLPFQNSVWLCLISLIFLTSTIFITSAYIEWKLFSSNEKPSFADIFLIVFGACCQQGSAFVPRSISSRFILVVTFMTLMFMYTSYSAHIVALIQSPSTRIKTLKDLFDSELEIAAEDTVYNQYFFPQASGKIRKAIFEQRMKKKDGSMSFVPLIEGIHRIREGSYAFHFETGVGYKYISDIFLDSEKCSLQGIKFLQIADPSYAIQKNSSYKDLLKSGMMRLEEHGLKHRENTRIYTKPCKCVERRFFTSASLVDIMPAMLILFWGIALSLIILTIEIVHFGLNKSEMENHQK